MSDPFDLSSFAPPERVSFRLRKHGDKVFYVDGDPDVDDIARMLRIENVIRGIDGGDLGAALLEGKDMLIRMVQEHDPDVTDLRVGAQDIAVVFALIVHGSTVAEAVMAAITVANARSSSDESGSGERDESRAGEGGGVEDAAPLPSPRPSSDRSSSSDERDGSLQAIGTA